MSVIPDEWPPPVPATEEEYNDLWDRVCSGEVIDPTPFGIGHDHCPYCGADWKKPHDAGCVSPFADDPPGGGFLP
jgi:hypothetical protein